MNHRTTRAHHHHRAAEPYLKYLKPGALAQLRDSRRTTARSHRISTLAHYSPPPNESQISILRDGFPCFAPRSFGPRFLQRKKLAAAKGFSYLALRVAAAAADVPDPDLPDLIVDLVGGGGDVVAAH